MSAIIKTLTPFLDISILKEAISECGYHYVQQANGIEIVELKGYRPTIFVADSRGRFTLTHDSHTRNIKEFLEKITSQYKIVYARKQEELRRLKEEEKRMAIEKENALVKQEQLSYEQKLREIQAQKQRAEEEMLKVEQEKKAYIESQKKAVYEKAKEMGYEVEEVKKANKIQLVLVKRK